jgi:uncharacterized membrane protein
MTHVLDYLSTLLHVLGMLLFVGGHIWLGIFSSRVGWQSQGSREHFVAVVLPVVANGFGVGVLLLFSSGLLKLFLWGEPGLIFLPDLYGWLMLSKLVLYMVIVGNGIWIERRYLPEVCAAGPDTALAWARIKVRARVNLLLALIVVALGETLRFSRL